MTCLAELTKIFLLSAYLSTWLTAHCLTTALVLCKQLHWQQSATSADNAIDKGFPKCSVRSPRASQEKLRGSANEEYKQEVFYPAPRVLFTMAIPMYRAVFSGRTELLRSNEIDLEKHEL